MKKFIFLILAAIFCLPSIASAQTLPQSYNKDLRRVRLHYGDFAIGDYIVWAKNRVQQKAYLDAKVATECVTDEATGQTSIRWDDGSAYQGQTYYGEIKGVGTMIYPDGSKYVGLWERDLPNGKGTFQTPEGIMYTVNFENGIPHGKGVIQDLDGRMYTARWVHGKLKEKSIKPLKKR